MKLDWAKLKSSIEHGLNSAKNDERGGVRVHCGSAERMLKGAKGDAAKEILDKVHHAKTSIEVSRAVGFLEEALTLVSKEVPAS